MERLTILADSASICLAHVDELAYVINKRSKTRTFMGDFYGNPTCGLISDDESWCLVGGAELVLWHAEEVVPIINPTMDWIFDLRQIGDHSAAILVDPWCLYAAIWELDVKTRELTRMCDFDDYRGLPYTEDVKW